MYLLAELTQERRFLWFLRFSHLANMARILLASIRRGGFRLSKISENATITRHSGDEIPTTVIVNIK